MKKFAIVAIIAALTSCGSSETKAPATKTDSTGVKKSDSAKVETTKTVKDTVK